MPRLRSDERKRLEKKLPDVDVEELDESLILEKSRDSESRAYSYVDYGGDNVEVEEDEDGYMCEAEGNDEDFNGNDSTVTEYDLAGTSANELMEEDAETTPSARRSLRQLPKLTKGSPSNFIANKLKSNTEEHVKSSHQLRRSSSSQEIMAVPTFSLVEQILENQGSSASKQSPGDAAGAFVCDLCGRRYAHHRSLNDHKKYHLGATTCPICKKAFSKVANMRAHFAAQHVKELAQMNFQN